MVGDNTLRGARRHPNHPTGASSPRAPELSRQSLARSRLRIRGVLPYTPQEAKPEYAHQGGHICDRSRHLRE